MHSRLEKHQKHSTLFPSREDYQHECIRKQNKEPPHYEHTPEDFALEDLEGNVYKLSDYRGKYVLLEFSASWCGWCKLEIPFLETVYKNTQGKNFVMFTINLDDERGKWEEDVKHDNLPWKVISDLKAFESPVAKNYNVSGIPMIYLIDPEGKIKEKGLRREEMIEYINTLFE